MQDLDRFIVSLPDRGGLYPNLEEFAGYCRWRTKYGGFILLEMKRLRQLEGDKQQLKILWRISAWINSCCGACHERKLPAHAASGARLNMASPKRTLWPPVVVVIHRWQGRSKAVGGNIAAYYTPA